MDKIIPSSKSAQEQSLFDFSKIVSSNYSQSKDGNFKNIISERKRDLSSTSDYNQRSTDKKTEITKYIKKADYSKDKSENVDDKNNIKDDKTSINQDDKDIKNENTTKKSETSKTDAKEQKKIKSDEASANETGSSEEEISYEDYIYVSADIIDAIKQLFAMEEQGIEVTDEKIQELFKDVTLVDMKDFILGLKSKGIGLEKIQDLEIKLNFNGQNNVELIVNNEKLTPEVSNAIKELTADIYGKRDMLQAMILPKDMSLNSLIKEDADFNLEDEIAFLKQETTRGEVPRVVNPEMKDFNQNQNFYEESDELLGSDYANYTVKLTGSVDKATNLSKFTTDMTTQIQNFSKIIDEINVAYRTNKNTINLKLEPESLGKLSVKINSENGVLNASFYVDNERAKRAIEEQIQQLRDTLVQQGLNISDINVQVGQNTEDYNLHKNIMEATSYSSSLSFDNGEVDEDEFENVVNPYIEEDLFNDVI